MILFLSKYPQTDEDFREGFFQRVIHIDSLFEDKEKVYLSTSLFKYHRKTYLKDEKGKRIIVQCNLLLSIGLIFNLFKSAKMIYVHSIHNLLYMSIFLKIFKKTSILDLHGLVPEEFALQGQFKKMKLFNAIEKFVYKNFDFVIGVTNRLVNFYKVKYPKSKAHYIVYPILPNNILNVSNEDIEDKKNSSTVNFIYSGNLQVWQNIDLMLYYIKKISQQENYFFQILTAETQVMKAKFIEENISMHNVDIRGVKPHELHQYYKNAHYGFILRDDIPVNNVSCPTKLIEYMNYGIIPIVLSDEIGDFKTLGFRSISVNNLSENLEGAKDLHNKQIIINLYSENKKTKEYIMNIYN